MSGKTKFYICNQCGNMMGLIKDKGMPVICCGKKMTELVPNTVEASVEKHLPEISFVDGILSVQVGSTIHPMDADHLITFVYVETEQGGQRKNLVAGDVPKMSFNFVDDKPIAVYAYCNLHGIWKTEVK